MLNFVIDHVDAGPPELAEQQPLHCGLIRVLPGADRTKRLLVSVTPPVVYYPQPNRPVDPDDDERYTHYTLPRPETFPLDSVHPQLLARTPDGRPMVSVPALVITGRYPGVSLDRDTRHAYVNIAYVVDTPTPERLPELRSPFFAAIGTISATDQAPTVGTSSDALEPEPFGRRPHEIAGLLLPTPNDQRRIDTLLAEAIQARDNIPDRQRIRNENPRYNKQFGPDVPENDVTPGDLERYRITVDRGHR